MNLSYMRVKLYHENCWTSELTHMFPDDSTIVPYFRKIVGSTTTTYTMVRTSRTQAKNVVHSGRYYRFNPKILGSLSSRGHNQIFIMSFQFKASNSIYRGMKEIEEAIPIWVFYEGEFEVWNFLIPENGSKNYKKRILEGMQEVTEIKGYKFKDGYNVLKENINSYIELILPPRTMTILHQLVEIGYFDFPRRVSIDGAADKVGISKGFISKVSRKIFDIIRPDSLENKKSM
ncbi:MAG: helix-turn-helix domain-containing protein [Candidatus Micrarchaeia archaeon]